VHCTEFPYTVYSQRERVTDRRADGEIYSQIGRNRSADGGTYKQIKQTCKQMEDIQSDREE
jgi:hypothetical protein